MDMEIARSGTVEIVLKPSFRNLLTAARVVELDDDVGGLDSEISGRIVEGEMAIFTDANERKIDRRLHNGIAGEADDLGGICVALQQMAIGDPGFANQPFPKVLAKARRVIHRQTDILVQMKEFDALPIDAGSCRQRLEECELRCSGRGYDASPSAKSNRRADCVRGLIGCRSRQRIVVVKYVDDHLQWS